MGVNDANSRPEKRVPKPLDEVKLRDLAIHYAARYATTAAKLEGYLIRKIRERGMAQQDEAVDIPAVVSGIVDRLVELKYVDDDAFAKARSGSLLRRGYGAKRVSEDLRHAGVDENTRQSHAPAPYAAREAAMTLARKRRFGPFGKNADGSGGDENTPLLDPAKRQKQISAMLRAGHGFDAARAVIDARCVADIEEWLADAEDPDDASSDYGLEHGK